MAAAELTTLPANANPADYNRIERFELTVMLAGVKPAPSILRATTAEAAKIEAGKVRETLASLPTFQGASLRRVVRYVYEPYCADKHDNVEC